jgi:hypothetical protein
MPSPLSLPSARVSSYVKENDVKYGVSVTSRVLQSGNVNVLQCRFCVAFGREERVGSKRKSSHASGQSWTVPFRYDNIETHMRTHHHPFKCAQYKELKKVWNYASRYEQCNTFFTNVTATPRSYF